MNTAARLTAALEARNLTEADVDAAEAISFADDVEAEYGATLTEADWDTVINSYSVSGLVIC
jgi:hypothetical protein